MKATQRLHDADRDDILRWLAGFHHAPRLVWVVHGRARPRRRARSGHPDTARVAHDGQTIGLEQ